MSDVDVYPLFLLLRGRLVTVIGGGAVAERKVEALLEAGAAVRVVALDATTALLGLAAARRVEHRRGAFEPGQLDGAWLVFACTDDADVQRAIAAECDRRRLFCVAVDDIANASAYGGSVLRRPPFTIAISSGGAAPALTRLVREVLDSALPPADFVARARALRARWQRDRTPMAARFPALLRELAGLAERERE